jgi:hypothetical protein
MLRDALAAFQPGEIGFIANPYPAYDELRRAGRIHYDERRGLKSLPVRV